MTATRGAWVSWKPLGVAPMSAEALQPAFSVYGTDRMPPAGGLPVAMSRQEQTTAWGAISNALGLHITTPVNLSAIWSLLWCNTASLVLANMDELSATWVDAPAGVLGVVRRGGCLDTLTANASRILDGTLVVVEASAATIQMYAGIIRLLLSASVPKQCTIIYIMGNPSNLALHLHFLMPPK